MEKEAAEHRTNILLVDDREENLVALRAVLKDVPANLVSAKSGFEALEEMSRAQFALILMDVNMPEMDGFETAKLLRSRPTTKHTPIIFITAAHIDELDVKLGYDSGAIDYLVKPFNPHILKSKVNVFIELAEYKNEVLRLREIIPICSYCKQIRDDKGYWQQLEAYFSTYGGASFSHGICPDCFEKEFND